MKRMKLILPLLTIGLIGFSCSEDEVETPTQMIVGSWKVTDVQTDGLSNYDEILIENPCFTSNSISFQDGGNYLEEFYSNNQTTGNCESEGIESGNWSVNENQFSTTINGVTETGEIEFLTNHKAIITIISEVGIHKTELTRI